MSASHHTTKPMFRLCSQCNRDLPLTNEFFHTYRRNVYGLCTICKECKNENVKKWQSANADKVKQIKRDSKQRNKERYALETRKRYREDAEFRSRRKKASDAWKSKNVSRCNANQRKRRDNPQSRLQNRLAQLVRNRNTLLTDAQIYGIWESLEGRCAYCGISIFLDLPFDAPVEHIIPIARGGTGDLKNLTLVCRHCNCQKNDRLYDEWKVIRGW